MMEVLLYNSTVCRLCGEENDNGTLLYTNEENNQNLCEIINSYLPLKVLDDGELPRTICPGCTIQVEATVEFFNLIINGQKVLRELHDREKDYKKNILCEVRHSNTDSDKIIYEINTSDGVYHMEHPISLQMAGLAKPKRKRGRPSKKPKTPEQLAEEAAAAAAAKELEARHQAEIEVKESETTEGKRRRKAPTRFKEVVQGKELEKIFLEEGVIDGEESDVDNKAQVDLLNTATVKEPEVIGHLETSGGPVVVVKGRGRGRPKGGRLYQKQSECPICGMIFTTVGRYMSHVASHGPMLFRCDCGDTFDSKTHIDTHQQETGHTGQTILPQQHNNKSQSDESHNVAATNTTEEVSMTQDDPLAVSDKTDTPEEQVRNADDGVTLGGHKQEPADGDDDVAEQDESHTHAEEVSEKQNVDAVTGKAKIKCPHCEKVFSSKQSKSMHIKAVHRGERAYKCEECGASFPYPRSLVLHALSHRNTRGPNFKGYACDVCGKILNHPSSVEYHKQSVHSAQRYVCGSCGKAFRHRQLLHRHQLVHSQHRPFRCKICDVSFKTKVNLKNHTALHSGIKKFCCDICKCRFSHKTSLTLHLRWHAGEKPFACKTCGKSFTQKGNLMEHERIHTGEKPFACRLCPRRFTTSSQHRLHLRRHHGPLTSAPVAGAATKAEVITKRSSAGHTYQVLTYDDNSNSRSIVVKDDVQMWAGQEECGAGEVVAEDAESGVIYVAYDNSEPYQILDTLQDVSISEGAHVEVRGEEGDVSHHLSQQVQVQVGEGQAAAGGAGEGPLQFRMQDGSLLAITSLDGHSLQIVTQDGQTIPVEINSYENMQEAVRADHADPQQSPPARPAPAPAHDPPAVTHYFTIV